MGDSIFHTHILRIKKKGAKPNSLTGVLRPSLAQGCVKLSKGAVGMVGTGFLD
jgi:hypothetical protein